MSASKSKASSASIWARRGGAAVFLFFFIKGLVWIGVVAAASLGIATL